MNIKKTAIGLIALSALALPAFAATINGSIGASVNAGGIGAKATVKASEKSDANAKDRADIEIKNRTDALTSVGLRINDMKLVSDSDKAALASEIQAQINELASLKVKIDADTSTTTLKEDIKSITGTYRIYMLVVPQLHILSAAHRLTTLASTMAAVSTKLQARITEAGTAGKNVTAIQANLSDMNAKIGDITVQAQASISGVSSLTPDGGDSAKATANTAALKAARANIQAGVKDAQAARKDAAAIIKALKGFHLDAGASASASSTTTTP